MEAPGVEPARRMIENPSAAPTCTVITATWRFRDGAGEGGWEPVRSGESGSSGRQVGDKKNKRAFADKVPSVNRAGLDFWGLRPPAGEMEAKLAGS